MVSGAWGFPEWIDGRGALFWSRGFDPSEGSLAAVSFILRGFGLEIGSWGLKGTNSSVGAEGCWILDFLILTSFNGSSLAGEGSSGISSGVFSFFCLGCCATGAGEGTGAEVLTGVVWVWCPSSGLTRLWEMSFGFLWLCSSSHLFYSSSILRLSAIAQLICSCSSSISFWVCTGSW